MLLYRYAVIYGIPIEVTIEEIEENLECKFPIIKVQKLKKKMQGANDEYRLVDTKCI